LALGGPKADGQVEGQDRVWAIGPVEVCKGLCVVTQGVMRGESFERSIGRLPAVAHGLREGARLRGVGPVPGQLAHPCTGAIPAKLFEGFGHPPVCAGTAGRAQVFIKSVLDESVGEAVAPGYAGQLPHERHRRSCVEHIEELIFRCGGGPGQEAEIEVPADNRSDRQHPLGVLPQPPDAGTDHHAHAVGQGQLLQGGLRRPPTRRVLVDGPGFRQVTQHLGHEERVAVGLPIHRMGEGDPGVIEGVSGRGLQQRHDARVIEPG